MSGLLKTRLFELEKQAETLERIVHKELIELQFVPDKEVRRYEQSILRKLRKLDDIQDEIDMLNAKLKEAGEWTAVSYSGNVYEYKAPKYVRPKPEPKPRKPRKVYPVESPRQAKPKKHVPDRDRKLKVVKPPKVKPEPKPKVVRAPKPKQSKELQDAKRRVFDNQQSLNQLDAVFEKRRIDLERRLEERQAKIVEVANLTTAAKGPQRRNTARKSLENVEQQLRELPDTKAARIVRLNELIEQAKQDVVRLENDSQLI